MKAIRTHYVGPSNTKGSRIIADDGDGNRVTLGYDDALDSVENHRRAALALSDKMGWGADLVQGYHRDGCYWVEPARHDTTDWEEYGVASMHSGPRYNVWRRRMDGVAIYSVTNGNYPPGKDEGGYPNLQSLMRLKCAEHSYKEKKNVD